uniref:Serine/arginine repetitive matrix protein 2 n=1 Tax=Panagrellus redivivus TaxID=6233 RepID=A0A7E4V6R7_PANRE
MDIRRRRGSTRSEVDSDNSDRSRDSSRRRRRVRKSVAARRTSRPVRGQRRPRVSRSSGQARVARQPVRRVAPRAQPQPESSYEDEEVNSVASSRASRRAPVRRRAAPRRVARRASSSRSGSSTGRRRRAYVRRLANSNSSRRGRRGRTPVRSVRSVPRDAGVQRYYPNASPAPSSSRRAPRSNLRFREPVAADSMDSSFSAPVKPFNPSGFSTPLQVNRNRRVDFGASPSPVATPSSARRSRITGREPTPCPTSATKQARHRYNRLGSVDYYQPQSLFSDDSSGDEDVFEQENSSFFRTPPTRETLRIRAREQTPMPTSATRQARHRYPRMRSLSSSDDEYAPQELFPAEPKPTPSFIRRRQMAPIPQPDIAVEGSASEGEGQAVNNVVHAGATPNQSFQYNQSDDEENLLPVGGPNPQ